jgi:hypothetical protein
MRWQLCAGNHALADAGLWASVVGIRLDDWKAWFNTPLATTMNSILRNHHHRLTRLL